MCVKGKYPLGLIDCWKSFDEKKKEDSYSSIPSNNDCPSIFKEDQLFIVLDIADGGKDLEAFKFKNPSESLSVFTQVANFQTTRIVIVVLH